MRYDGWFTLCGKHGRMLHEVMGWGGLVTHRQFKAWCAWDDMQMNRPDRHDYYQMQSAMESCRQRLKNPRAVDLADFRLRFQPPRKAQVDPSLTGEQLASHKVAISKARWCAAMGMPVVVKEVQHGTAPADDRPDR